MNNITSNANQRTFIWTNKDVFGANQSGTLSIIDNQFINSDSSFFSTVFSLPYISSFGFDNPMIEDICDVSNPIITTELSIMRYIDQACGVFSLDTTNCCFKQPIDNVNE